MNKIFKCIYNHATGTFVAVSELARSNGIKSTSHSTPTASTEKSSGVLFKLSAVFATLLTALSVNTVYAADAQGGVAINGTDSNGNAVNKEPEKAVTTKVGATDTFLYSYQTPGNKSYDNPNEAATVGLNQKVGYVSRDKKASGVAIGKGADAAAFNISSSGGLAAGGISIGDWAQSSGTTIAIGHAAKAMQLGALAVGTATRAEGFNSFAAMRQSVAKGDFAAAVGTAAVADGTLSTAIGHSSTAKGNRAIAIGSANAQKIQGEAVNGGANKATAYDGVTNTEAVGDSSIALGASAKALGGSSIAEGTNAISKTSGSIAIGANSQAGQMTIPLSDAGVIPVTGTVKYKKDKASPEVTFDITKGKSFESQEKYEQFLMGTVVSSDKDAGTIVQDYKRSHLGHMNNVAIGESAVAHGGRNISIGEKAGGIVGDTEKKHPDGSITYEFKDKTLEKQIDQDNWNIHNVNIGTKAGANSKKDYSVAIGNEAGALSEDVAKVQRSIYNGADMGKRSPTVYIGDQAGKDSISYGTVAIGDGAGANMKLNSNNQESRTNVFIGTAAGAGVTTNDGVLEKAPLNGSGMNIGLGNSALQNVNGDGNIGLGLKALRSNNGDNNIGIGNIVGSNGGLRKSDRNIMIGTQVADIKGDNGKPNVDYTKNILIGNWVNSGKGNGISVSNAIGIGSEVNALGNGSIALGATALAAKTAALATAMGPGSQVNAVSAQALGHEANVATGADRSMAIGKSAVVKAGATDAIAQGTEAEVSAEAAIAIGAKGKKKDADQNEVATSASGKNAIAIGTASTVSGNDSISVGRGNTVSGNNSGAFGDPSTVSGTGSYSVGNDNNITANDAFAMGSNVKADVANSVYLGKDARATAGNEVGTLVLESGLGSALGTTTAGNTGTVNEATVNGVTYGGFAAPTAVGVVTVGSAGAERRIQNVAAGEISATSSDAINGSQLWNVVDKGGITFQNGEGANTDPVKSNFVKLGDTVTIEGDGDVHVLFDPKKNKYTIASHVDPNGGDGITGLTVKADQGTDINLDKNNTELYINGDNDLISTSSSGQAVKVSATEKLTQAVEQVTTNTNSIAGNTTKITKNEGDITELKKGWKLTTAADGGEVKGTTVAAVQTDNVVTVKAGENIAVKQDDKAITIATKKDVSFDNVTVGDTVINKTTGINAGNKPITNVASGGDTDTNAANISDVKKITEAKAPVVKGAKQATVASKDVNGHKEYTVSATKTTVEKGSDDIVVTAEPETEDGVLNYKVDLAQSTKDNIDKGVAADNAIKTKGIKFGGDAGNVVTKKLGEQVDVKGGITSEDSVTGGNIGVFADGSSTLNIKLAKNLTGLTSAVFDGNTTINGDGVTITDGPSMTKDGGINAGNKPITNVAMGADPKGTDAVNVDYLEKAIKGATPKVGKFGLTADSGDAVKKDLDQTIAVNGDGTNISTSTEVGTGVKVELKKNINLGDTGSVQTGATTINNEGVTTPKVTVAGDKNTTIENGKVTGLEDRKPGTTKDYASDPSRAATEGAVKAVDDKVNTNAGKIETLEKGWKVDVDKEGTGVVTSTTSEKAVKANDKVTVKAGDNMAIKLEDKNITLATKDEVSFKKITLDDKAGNTTNLTSTANGLDVGGDKITNVADGDLTAESKDAVNGSQLFATNQKVEQNTTNINKNKEAIAKGTKYQGDVGKDSGANAFVRPLGEVTTINGGVTEEAKLTDGNIGVVSNNADTLTVKLAKALNDLESATFGSGTDSTVINKDGMTIKEGDKTVSLTEGGLNNGGNKITNVAKGTDPTDAVNKSQLDEAVAGAKGKPTSVVGEGSVKVEKLEAKNSEGGNEYKVSLDKDVTVGDAKNPGTITVKGENGKDAVAINGKDGSIGLTGPTGKDGADGVTTIKVVAGDTGLDGKDGTNGKDGKDAKKPRLEVNGEQVATLKDGLKFKGNGEKTVDKKLNETVTIKGGMTDLADDKATDKNTRVDVDKDGNLVVKLAKELQDLDKVVVGAEPGKDGNDGKPGIALDGKNGTIGITGPAGENGAPGVSTTITVKDGKPGVDGQPGKDGKNPRLVVGDKEVATLDDGIKYVGDFKTASAVKLNKDTTLTGEVGSKAEADFTTGNIAVVADKENSTDSAKLTLKLAKDLTGLTSVTTTDADGNTTVQNGNGVTITPKTPAGQQPDPKKVVSLTKDGLNNGGNQIKNVASGLPKGTDLANASGDTLTNAANIGDLKKAAAASKTTVTSEDKSVKIEEKVDPNDKHVNYDLSVNAQGVVNEAQLPVVYTDKEGNKVYKVGDNFFKNPEGTGDQVPTADVIASMNDGSNNAAPTQLANVKSAIDDQTGDNFAKKLEAAAKDPIGQNSAVNVSDLKNATDGVTSAIVAKGLEFAGNTGNFHRDLGQTVTIKGEGTLADDQYSGDNIKTIADDQGNITIKMAKDLKVDNVDVKDNVVVGPKGKDGQPGEGAVVIGKNGKDGKDGTNGISIKGKDGKDAVAINGKDGVGTIGLTGEKGKDGKPAEAIIGVKDGAKGLDGNDGKDGESKTRIVYTKPDNTTEEVATLNDGLMFQGNNTDKDVIKKKLNTVMTIKGGFEPATGTFADTTTAANNYVENDGENLVIRMAKKLTDLESAVFGTDPTSKDSNAPGVKVDGETGAITSKNAAGNTITLNNDKGQITGVESGLKGDDPNKPIKLSEAEGDTLKNAANIGDLKNAVNNVTDAANGGGFGLTDDKGAKVTQDLGKQIQIKGKDGVTVTANTADKALEIGLSNNVTIGDDKKPGTVTVKGENGKDGVAINGKDGGSIVVGGKDGVAGKDGAPGVALNGKDGSIGVAGKDGANADITTSKGDAFLGGKGDDGKDGKNGTRITYQPKDKDGNPVGDPKQVATMDDGIAYEGDSGKANVKLNKVTSIVGGVKEADKLADGNIGVVAEQDGDNAKLTVKLAKELKGLTSVTTTDADGNKTVQNGKGVTITPDTSKPENKDKKPVSLTSDGLNNGGNTITNVAEGVDDSDAVNVKQLNDKVSGMGWNINTYNKTNEGDISPVKNDKTVKFGSADGSIQVSHEYNEKDGNVKVDLALGNDVKIGGLGADGKPGKDGKLGVNGKDGKTGVAIDGANGTVGLTGPAGKDGKNPNAVIGVKDGAPGLDGNDGKDGASKTRVVYTKPDGKVEEVATLNDGVKYEGDQGKAAVKLNQTTKVVGGAKGELTDGNIGVVASQDGKNAKLTVKLAKDLKGLNSVEAKDVTVKKGGNLKVENGANVDMGGNQVKNIASGISGKSYRNPKDNNAANIGDVKAIANQAVAPLNKRINDVDKHASAGTASAMAAAGLPQAYLPGHSMVAVGAGTHRGQNAIAVGVSRISDSGHVVIKLNGATNSKGDTSGSVGVGYQW